MVVKLCEFMSVRHAALPEKNFPVARQSDPSPPTEVNNPASAINLKKNGDAAKLLNGGVINGELINGDAASQILVLV